MKAKVLVGLRSMKRWSTDIEHLEWICTFLVRGGGVLEIITVISS